MTTTQTIDHINEVCVAFGSRHVRMEKRDSSYRIGWYKPDEDNGAVMVASQVVISDIAMQATIAAYLELNKEETE
jgi:hypothetical protein